MHENTQKHFRVNAVEEWVLNFNYLFIKLYIKSSKFMILNMYFSESVLLYIYVCG